MLQSAANIRAAALLTLAIQSRTLSVSAVMLSARQARRQESVYKEIEKHTSLIAGLSEAGAAKQKKKAVAAITALHAKELKNLDLLKKKIKEQQKALVARNKEEYKKLLAKATKPCRRMPAIAAYIKENAGSGVPLTDLSRQWSHVTADEKERYQQLADKIYEETLRIWTPEPKSPPNAYASFIQKHYPDGVSFAEASKQISAQWKALSDAEKEKHKPSAQELEKYAAEKKAWIEKRVQLYLDAKAKK
ncbi:hypothetical protein METBISCDRAFT_27074 [Metschnikowia bicuspidata]|uniref:HMG box domain-containing protein n=1 Tax=Metschnikowia bicuspidata TaxID=27322 RepID=A0A4P9ZEF5_9ASCO|nr:hypothetical protein METBISCDRAFT_27074 [Metschnikowia bicuspidata]